MIWYFLAGFIAGVVGTYMFGRWCADHISIIEMGEQKDDERPTDHSGYVD